MSWPCHRNLRSPIQLYRHRIEGSINKEAQLLHQIKHTIDNMKLLTLLLILTPTLLTTSATSSCPSCRHNTTLIPRGTPNLQSLEACKKHNAMVVCCKHNHGHKHHECTKVKALNGLNCEEAPWNYQKGPFCCKFEGGPDLLGRDSPERRDFTYTWICPAWMQSGF
jgi:hypothetical protein